MSCCFSIVRCCCPWKIHRPEFDEEEGADRSIEDIAELGLSGAQEAVVERKYLPAKHPMAALTYLTIYADQREIHLRSPFPMQHDLAFQSSEQANNTAKRWLWFGSTFSVICTSGSLLAGGWLNTSASTTWFGVSFFSGVIGSITSILATGTYPDISSNYADKRQDAFHEVQKIYDDIAFQLVTLSFDDLKKAKRIASDLKLKRLSYAFRGRITTHEAHLLITPIREARGYVRKGNMPEHTKILKLYIESRRMKAEIDDLRGMVRRIQAS